MASSFNLNVEELIAREAIALIKQQVKFEVDRLFREELNRLVEDAAKQLHSIQVAREGFFDYFEPTFNVKVITKGNTNV